MFLKKSKRSQAAMEFLSTYGWAMLIVVIVIVALVAVGVLYADNFLPERAEIKQGIQVMSASVDENSITMILQNNLGKNVNNIQINATECRNGAGAISEPVDIPEGATKKVTIICEETGSIGTRFKSNLEVNYSTSIKSNEEYIMTHATVGGLQINVNMGNTTICGNGNLEPGEICDSGITTECAQRASYYRDSYVEDGSTCNSYCGCKSDCSACVTCDACFYGK